MLSKGGVAFDTLVSMHRMSLNSAPIRLLFALLLSCNFCNVCACASALDGGPERDAERMRMRVSEHEINGKL